MEELTQRERLAAALLKLKEEITTGDREAYLALPDSKSGTTLSNYLNGTVRDNDTAVELITFFRGRIANREKALS